MNFIFFTDLDGTLLDHHSYSYLPAQPALDRLHRLDIPLILASSKTALEIAPLRMELGFAHCPAIVENGAGLLAALETPPEEVSADSDYQRLRQALEQLPSDLRGRFTGFGDLDVDEVARITGLSLNSAQLAKVRQFSEPGLWRGSDEQLAAFLKAIQTFGVEARRGGRFLTLSFGAKKADRMQEIVDRLAGDGKRPLVIALGDAPNDIEMLQAADIGVVIHNPDSKPLPELRGEATGAILRSIQAGPEGWNRMVLQIVERKLNHTNER